MPEMTYWLEWDTGPAGSFEMLGDQMCGADHPTLRGDLVVESLPAFVDWLADRGVASESTVAQRSR